MEKNLKICDDCPNNGEEYISAKHVCMICGKDLCSNHALTLELLGHPMEIRYPGQSINPQPTWMINPPKPWTTTTIPLTRKYVQQAKKYDQKAKKHLQAFYARRMQKNIMKSLNDSEKPIICRGCLEKLNKSFSDGAYLETLKKMAMCETITK